MIEIVLIEIFNVLNSFIQKMSDCFEYKLKSKLCDNLKNNFTIFFI